MLRLGCSGGLGGDQGKLVINLLIPQREKEMYGFTNHLLRRDQLALLWGEVIAGIL